MTRSPFKAMTSGRRRFAAGTALYCLACWGLVYWGVLETFGYAMPYPWIGVALLELPLSLVLVGLYMVLSMMRVAETLGTVMGFVLVFGFVALPLPNALLLRRLWRRYRRGGSWSGPGPGPGPRPRATAGAG